MSYCLLDTWAADIVLLILCILMFVYICVWLYTPGLPPDEYATLATAVFDTQEQTMTVYLNNPKTEPHTLVRHFK